MLARRDTALKIDNDEGLHRERFVILVEARKAGAARICHTAIIADLVGFEGRISTADMRRLLGQQYKGGCRLDVAVMPLGSPGIEARGAKLQPFNVIAFGPAGQRVYCDPVKEA